MGADKSVAQNLLLSMLSSSADYHASSSVHLVSRWVVGGSWQCRNARIIMEIEKKSTSNCNGAAPGRVILPFNLHRRSENKHALAHRSQRTTGSMHGSAVEQRAKAETSADMPNMPDRRCGRFATTCSPCSGPAACWALGCQTVSEAPKHMYDTVLQSIYMQSRALEVKSWPGHMAMVR